MILNYIIEVILFQLGFLLAYELFLKRETFFNYNRLYLLLTPLLAFLIPFLRLEFLVEAVPQNTVIRLPEVFIGTETTSGAIAQTTDQTSSAFEINWWYVTYFTGFAVSLLLFLKKYHNLNKLFRFRKVSEEKNFRIIEVPDSNIACTFFSTVFLGDQLSDEEKQQILSHELVHVTHKHSLDLVFFEIMKIIFWFNPLIYIYQSRIAGLHEFIADQEVVKTTGKKTYYEQLLNSAFSTQNISFINQFFNHSLIKKRIIMLQKTKSSKLSKLRFLLIIPLMLAMLTYVACSEDIDSNETDLDQFSYSLEKGEDLQNDPEKTQVHNKYESFLFNNPDYVGWATIGKNGINYSVHPADEKVPSGYRKMEVAASNGDSYVMYMNISPGSSDEKRPEEMEAIKLNQDYDSEDKIPFAVIEQVPTFPECADLPYNEDKKKCVSRTISNFVNKNFNTALGKELGLTGVNRVIVQFRIDETGKVQDIKSRAAHPKLEEEAKRVIASLPDFIPGEQSGRPVSVMYSLPIAFKVAE